MFWILTKPAKVVCDALGVTDEGERGMIRMLVNMLLLTVVGVLAFVVVVKSF